MDMEQSAPQLSVRETLVAGTHLVLDTLFLLLIVGVPVLVANLFSPTLPVRFKLGNVVGLLALLGLPAAIIALLVWLI